MRGSTVQYIKTIQTSETGHCPALPETLIGEKITHYKAYRSPDIIKRGEINLTLSPSVHSFNHSTPVCTCQNDAYCTTYAPMLSSIHVPGTSIAYSIDYSYFNIKTVSTLCTGTVV